MSADRDALLEAALGYAARGWPVFPIWTAQDGVCRCAKGATCESPAKHPRTEHGLKDATTDPDVIRGWWRQWPRTNVGVRTGVAFDVLDVDSDAAGRTLAIAAQLAGEDTAECWGHGPLSLTRQGAHLLYEPTGAKNTTGLIVPKVDWRGAGGYIVAPPSVHASGHVYRWHDDCGPDTPLPLAPMFLVAALYRLLPTSRPHRKTSTAAGALGSGAGVAGIIARVATTVEGERNAVLNWAAYTLGAKVHRGELDEPSARRAADVLHAVALDVGLGDAEARATITSGWTAGINGRVAS